MRRPSVLEIIAVGVFGIAASALFVAAIAAAMWLTAPFMS